MATSNRDIIEFVRKFELRLPWSEETAFGEKPCRRLIDHFDQEFYCLSADETPIREAAYRLRYKVYCVENRFEDPAKNPDCQETDEFDSHAPHKLLFHRPSRLGAGVVRLILPQRDVPHQGLPFNALIGSWGPLGQRSSDQRMAEVSRFAVVPRVRDAIQQDASRAVDATERHASAIELMKNISIGLMRGVVELAAENEVSHLCALMEPALLRLLARLGVHFQPVGPMIHYHGHRQPCFADLDQLLARTWTERRDVWEVLTGEGIIWPVGRSAAALAGVETH